MGPKGLTWTMPLNYGKIAAQLWELLTNTSASYKIRFGFNSYHIERV